MDFTTSSSSSISSSFSSSSFSAAEAENASCISSLVDFLVICGRLKKLKRQGWVNCEVKRPESVADHMYRMAMCCFLIPDKEINREKCVKMALVHDLAEAYVGDITPFCGISKEEKMAREKAEMERIRCLVGGRIGQEMFDLWFEYENGNSAEATFVRDFDKMEMVLQAYEYEKDFVKKMDEEIRKRRKELPHIPAATGASEEQSGGASATTTLASENV